MATTAELYDQAVRYHQSGNLQQAESLYRLIIQTDRTHAAAHHLLGLLAHQAGHHQAALTLIRRAIELNPADADCQFNLGIVLMNEGQVAEAITCFRQALTVNPHHLQAQNNLGNALRDQGHLAEAVACYRQALRGNPQSATTHYNLGKALKDQGELTEAAECFRQALAGNPRDADAHNSLGIILKIQGRLAEAVGCFEKAISCNTRLADAHFNLGNALNDQELPAKAKACYRQVLEINPKHLGALNNLGIALHKEGHLAEAAACYRQALRVDRERADARNNLGNVLEEQGEIALAVECYREALRIDPQLARAHHNLSFVLTRLALLQQAMEHNAQALRINPAFVPALWQRALLNLVEGNFEAGWRDYEQRWALPGIASRTFTQPRWDGSTLEGKTILVFAEGGLGDTLQFVRYLPLVRQRGGHVIFECQPALTGLCAGIAGIDKLIPIGAPLPSFDVQAPLLSLPGIFGTRPETIPAPGPYARADAGLVDHWKEKLGLAGGFRVGIAWQGNTKYKGDHYRSVPLPAFQALATLEGVRLVSLQVGPGSEQLATAPFPILDLGSRFNPASLDDLAAVLMNLDIVVAVDSAVVHLAGALGVPAWILLPLSPDWRWFLDRSDSPWYPTVRLFRQTRFGDWESVIERIRESLLAQMPHQQKTV